MTLGQGTGQGDRTGQGFSYTETFYKEIIIIIMIIFFYKMTINI